MYHVEITTNFDWQNQAKWQTPNTPFMNFGFWQALADSGAIGDEAGWLPLFICLKNAENLVAVMPVFIKDHHQGEYVFDHAWAEAYYRYGADYYPRLVTSVPFTPVTGERVWLAVGQDLTQEVWQALQTGVDSIAKQIQASTWHGLFVNSQTLALSAHLPQSLLIKEALSTLEDSDLLIRFGCQFLWQNKNSDGEKFSDFDDFLAILTAKKRKSIRVERQKVAKQGLTCHIKLGTDISENDWQIFYQCYAMTYLVRGRQPYLSFGFFEQIGNSMSDNLMLAQAVNGQGEIVACALFFYDNETLYGRYWGCLAEYDSLHFELCYYQGIAFAIGQGLQYFDPGTQGEHKLIRGFVPTLSYSLHQVYNRRFKPAITDFCEQEQQAVLQYYTEAMTALPFNQSYLDVLTYRA